MMNRPSLLFCVFCLFFGTSFAFSSNLSPTFSRRGGKFDFIAYPSGAMRLRITPPVPIDVPSTADLLKGAAADADVTADTHHYTITSKNVVGGTLKVDTVSCSINRDTMRAEFSINGKPHIVVIPRSFDATSFTQMTLRCLTCESLRGTFDTTDAAPFVLGHHRAHTLGVLSLNPSQTEFHAVSSNTIEAASASGAIDVVVFPGPTPSEVLRQYHALVGLVHSLPPLWSLSTLFKDNDNVVSNAAAVFPVFRSINVSNVNAFDTSVVRKKTKSVKDLIKASEKTALIVDVPLSGNVYPDTLTSRSHRYSYSAISGHYPYHLTKGIAMELEATGQRALVTSATNGLDSFFGFRYTVSVMATGSTWSELKSVVPRILDKAWVGVGITGIDLSWRPEQAHHEEDNDHGCEPELIVRWFQLAAFLPFARLPTPPKFPANSTEEAPTTQAIREAINLRHQLMPYLYTQMYRMYLEGMPVIRPVGLEVPDSDFLQSKNRTFNFGPALLVRPVVERDPKMVLVTFPGRGNKWFDMRSGESYRSDLSEFMYNLKYGPFPMYIRRGHVVPTKDRIRRNATTGYHSDPMTLFVALTDGGRADGELYMDDGATHKYQRGHYLHRRFTMRHLRLTSRAHTEVPALSRHLHRESRAFRTQATVEKVIVYGMKESFEKIEIDVKGQRTQVPFKRMGNTVIIPRLVLDLNADWNIFFTPRMLQ